MADSSLPSSPDFRQLRNQAKELLRAVGERDPEAARRFMASHPRMMGFTADQIAEADCKLADAQLVLARELGFDTWAALKRHVEATAASSVDLHDLVTRDDPDAWQAAVAKEPGAVNQPSEAGLPPLYTAALYGNRAAVDFLLARGAFVDIFAAAYLGRPADAEALLNRDPALVNAKTADGMTALQYAARAGHLEVARELILHGADVNAQADGTRSSIGEACHGGPWKAEPADDIVQLLLDHGAQVDVFAAAATGRTDLIEAALEQDATSLNAENEHGETPLFIAAHDNRLDAVKLLVERGADINRSDAVGTAALHRTSQQCSDELIQYLIDNGANAHLCCYVACGDVDGTRSALARRPVEAEEILYEFNAVGYAIHSWQLETLRVLLEHGCRLSEEDRGHILRISAGNQDLLDELMAIQP